jgi:DNA invertase Pin-like site-specific DNA recombinase
MEQRLRSLGWQVIEVIDEDLGRSAAGDTQRQGFKRMVADVCLGKVGAVAASMKRGCTHRATDRTDIDRR